MELIERLKKLEITGIEGVEDLGLLAGLSEIHKIEMAHMIITATKHLIVSATILMSRRSLSTSLYFCFTSR